MGGSGNALFHAPMSSGVGNLMTANRYFRVLGTRDIYRPPQLRMAKNTGNQLVKLAGWYKSENVNM